MRFEKTLALRVKVPDSFLYPCVSDFRLGQLTFPDIRNYLSEEPNVLGFGSQAAQKLKERVLELILDITDKQAGLRQR
jgi:hypothetical protein